MVSTRFWYSSSASRKGQKQRKSQHGGWLGKEHTTAVMLQTTAQSHTATPRHSHHTSGRLIIDCKENRTTPQTMNTILGMRTITVKSHFFFFFLKPTRKISKEQLHIWQTQHLLEIKMHCGKVITWICKCFGSFAKTAGMKVIFTGLMRNLFSYYLFWIVFISNIPLVPCQFISQLSLQERFQNTLLHLRHELGL